MGMDRFRLDMDRYRKLARQAAADVLTGRVNPSGRLTDTIARKISDYPSDSCFGSGTENEYREDIYVGYRYFETFARDKVQYSSRRNCSWMYV